jgi:hypothetical protein
MRTVNKTEYARVEHSDKPYTRIDNDVIRNKNLSWKARGLLAYLLSHSEGYQVRIDTLHTFSKDGHGSTLSGIKELKKAGHMYFVKKQDPQTKQWLAGYWVISERSEQPNTLTADNPKAGKPCARVILRSENRLLSKKEQEEEEQKKEVTKEKKDFSKADKESFDPEDLPTHLGKNKAISCAWGRYVQSRKKHPITQIAFNMLVKKMLAYTAEEVVDALDRSVMNGWTGLFFNGGKCAAPFVSTSQPATPLDPDAQRLLDFVTDALSNEHISPVAIQSLVDQMHIFYDRVRTLRYPGNRNQDASPADRISWKRFFDEWLEFLEKKQADRFELQSVNNLAIGGGRWNEYIRLREYLSSYNWTTGKRNLS